MLGVVLCTVGLFFADSVSTLFRLFPMPILGVILFFGGLELAAGVSNEGFSHEERVVLVVTAAFALWNMGLGYLAGLSVYHASRRGFGEPLIARRIDWGLPLSTALRGCDCRR